MRKWILILAGRRSRVLYTSVARAALGISGPETETADPVAWDRPFRAWRANGWRLVLAGDLCTDGSDMGAQISRVWNSPSNSFVRGFTE